MTESGARVSLIGRTVARLPWARWAFWPWLRYTLRWKGWRARLIDNEPYAGQSGWKLHRCADGAQCRESIGGGCAAGWCAHCEVRPDECGIPRLPRSRIKPPSVRVGEAPRL